MTPAAAGEVKGLLGPSGPSQRTTPPVAEKTEIRAGVSGAAILDEKETMFKDDIRRLVAVLGARW